jgi:LCP family protein required for cell wall assembly
VTLASFVFGGLVAGALFMTTVYSLVRGENRPSTSLASLLDPVTRTPARLVGGRLLGGDGGAASNGTPLPVWSGTERVNILLLGIDRRPQDQGLPARTDTILIVTVDPITKTAGILSIPRDLLVHVPGYGEYRVNTAYPLGELERPPRGAQLAKETISANFGIPIHYYAMVDFRGFERIVDTLGGVVIDVPYPLKDDQYPSDVGDDVIRIFFDEGIQRMDGQQALRYARTRHADSDFGRNLRQQQMILALRQEALRLDILPRLPALFATLRDSFSTDIPPEDALALAALAWRIETKDIQRRAIDVNLIYNRGDGGLVPRRSEIAKLVRELFFDSRLRAEAARVEVLNGSGRQGLAGAVAQRLEGLGVQVVRVDNADRADYRETVVIDGTGKVHTVGVIARALNIPQRQIVRRTLDGTADVRVILGADARS